MFCEHFWLYLVLAIMAVVFLCFAVGIIVGSILVRHRECIAYKRERGEYPMPDGSYAVSEAEKNADSEAN